MNTTRSLLEQNTSLTLPLMNVGMLKAGTYSLLEFFKCKGLKSTHWRLHNESGLLGECIHRAVVAHKPPLKTCGHDVEAWMQLDVTYPGENMCFYPQMQYLEEIHKEVPNATFILVFRPMKNWVRSIMNWKPSRRYEAMGERLERCDFPGLPTGVGSNVDDFAQWFCQHLPYIRDFVRRYPTHKPVELSLYDKNNAATLSKLFDAPERCWGHANINEKLQAQNASGGLGRIQH